MIYSPTDVHILDQSRQSIWIDVLHMDLLFRSLSNVAVEHCRKVIRSRAENDPMSSDPDVPGNQRYIAQLQIEFRR